MSLPPVLKTKCKTCPFRKGSRYAHLVPELTHSALTESSRICHSTGSNAIHRDTGKEERLCRGARDVQLEQFHQIGIIDAPTDVAWATAWAQYQMEEGEI